MSGHPKHPRRFERKQNAVLILQEDLKTLFKLFRVYNTARTTTIPRLQFCYSYIQQIENKFLGAASKPFSSGQVLPLASGAHLRIFIHVDLMTFHPDIIVFGFRMTLGVGFHVAAFLYIWGIYHKLFDLYRG